MVQKSRGQRNSKYARGEESCFEWCALQSVCPVSGRRKKRQKNAREWPCYQGEGGTAPERPDSEWLKWKSTNNLTFDPWGVRRSKRHGPPSSGIRKPYERAVFSFEKRYGVTAVRGAFGGTEIVVDRFEKRRDSYTRARCTVTDSRSARHARAVIVETVKEPAKTHSRRPTINFRSIHWTRFGAGPGRRQQTCGIRRSVTWCTRARAPAKATRLRSRTPARFPPRRIAGRPAECYRRVCLLTRGVTRLLRGAVHRHRRSCARARSGVRLSSRTRRPSRVPVGRLRRRSNGRGNSKDRLNATTLLRPPPPVATPGRGGAARVCFCFRS